MTLSGCDVQFQLLVRAGKNAVRPCVSGSLRGVVFIPAMAAALLPPLPALVCVVAWFGSERIEDHFAHGERAEAYRT